MHSSRGRAQMSNSLEGMRRSSITMSAKCKVRELKVIPNESSSAGIIVRARTSAKGKSSQREEPLHFDNSQVNLCSTMSYQGPVMFFQALDPNGITCATCATYSSSDDWTQKLARYDLPAAREGRSGEWQVQKR